MKAKKQNKTNVNVDGGSPSCPLWTPKALLISETELYGIVGISQKWIITEQWKRNKPFDVSSQDFNSLSSPWHTVPEGFDTKHFLVLYCWFWSSQSDQLDHNDQPSAKNVKNITIMIAIVYFKWSSTVINKYVLGHEGISQRSWLMDGPSQLVASNERLELDKQTRERCLIPTPQVTEQSDQSVQQLHSPKWTIFNYLTIIFTIDIALYEPMTIQFRRTFASVNIASFCYSWISKTVFISHFAISNSVLNATVAVRWTWRPWRPFGPRVFRIWTSYKLKKILWKKTKKKLWA